MCGGAWKGNVVIDPDVGPVAPAAVKTILIVEDEVLVRMHLATALEDEGYRVIQAANAAEALATLETAIPLDLMATDVNMPGSLDGLQLASHVRMRWPDKKIVLISAHIHELPPDGSIDALLGKPFPMNDMLECIGLLLAAAEVPKAPSADAEPEQSLLDSIVTTVTGADDPFPEGA
jgi:CheY-like chemotaxis protein